jgi:hypothetical protein
MKCNGRDVTTRRVAVTTGRLNRPTHSQVYSFKAAKAHKLHPEIRSAHEQLQISCNRSFEYTFTDTNSVGAPANAWLPDGCHQLLQATHL